MYGIYECQRILGTEPSCGTRPARDVSVPFPKYTEAEVRTLMAAVSQGNEQTGGAQMVARGSGVVTFVELCAAHEEDDPASAAPSGPAAVIGRAEQLHRNRMELTEQRRYFNSGAVERAETAYARGAKRTAAIIFSGCNAHAVHRKVGL